MKIKLFKEYGALNSKPIFEAFEQGVLANRDTLVDSYEEADCVVIWSVLFQGRMAGNKAVWERAQKDKKPVIVLEVGTLLRDKTWRVGINGINRDAQWAEFWDISPQRSKLLGINLDPWQDNNKEFITIATQRPDSLQWVGMPSIESWVDEIVLKTKQVSKRPIVIRPHPRDRITNWNIIHNNHKDVYFDMPKSIGVSDHVNFKDILDRTHILINYCTTPAIEAILRGIPVVVGEPSMCWDLTTQIENIENPYKADEQTRQIWFDKLCHIEWFPEEIAEGTPWSRLRMMI